MPQRPLVQQPLSVWAIVSSPNPLSLASVREQTNKYRASILTRAAGREPPPPWVVPKLEPSFKAPLDSASWQPPLSFDQENTSFLLLSEEARDHSLVGLIFGSLQKSPGRKKWTWSPADFRCNRLITVMQHSCQIIKAEQSYHA